MRPKIFNSATTIENRKFLYPIKEICGVIFFYTADAEYFVYSMYTKSNLSQPSLNQVSLTTYNEVKEAVNSKLIEKAPEIYCEQKDLIHGIISIAQYKALVDNLTVEQYLKLNL